MKYLMINCREATFLMARKEEGRLSFKENAKLSIHTTMCSLCKKFQQQASNISEESKHIIADEELPDLARERIDRLMKEQY